MAEVSKIFFHYPENLEESIEIQLSSPAPVVGEDGQETELHLCLDDETFDTLYNIYKEYGQTLKEKNKEDAETVE